MEHQAQGLNIRDFTATGLNKEDEAFKVIFSDDEGNGAVAIELDKALEFINYYTRNDNVRGHKGYTLDLIIEEFAGLRRRVFESDAIYLRRFLALTERKKDKVWGTKWNIKHVFEMYFGVINAYVAENTNEYNIIENGDFEDVDNAPWELEGGAEISYSARFSGSKGLYFNRKIGSISYSIDLAGGVYILHWFLNGKIDIEIMNSAGQYWDVNNLAWVDNLLLNHFEKEVWDNCEMFIKVLAEESDTLTIKFINTSTENVVCLDYVRLFEKLRYPSYTVIIQYEGYAIADKTLHLGKGKADPDPAITWYPRESYFDNSYILGRIGAYRNEVYLGLLDIIRPRGIRAFVETVERVTED